MVKEVMHSMKTSPAMPGRAARIAGHSIRRKLERAPMPSWLASRHWSAGTVCSASSNSRVASGRLKKTWATRMPDRP